VQSSHEYSVLWGLAVFAVMGLFVLVLKWAYSSRPDSLLSRRPRRGGEDEYGLMSPLAAPKDAAEGEEICGLLRAAAIRSRLVHTSDGLRVMVWPDDLARARALLLE
jgi:hypothetical protein